MKQEQIDNSIKKLSAIQSFKASDAYTLLMGPLEEKIESLKHAYGMKAKEAERFDGLYEGLHFLPDLMNQYEQEGIRAQEANQRLEKKRTLDATEFDSTNL